MCLFINYLENISLVPNFFVNFLQGLRLSHKDTCESGSDYIQCRTSCSSTYSNILQDSHLKKLPLDELAHLRPSHLLKGLEIKRSPSIYALYINIFFPLLFLHLLSLSIIFLTTKYLSDTILSIHQQEPNQSWIEPTALLSIYIHLSPCFILNLYRHLAALARYFLFFLIILCIFGRHSHPLVALNIHINE